MSVYTAYTLTEARGYLEAAKEAHMQIITGQAKSYRIGTREYTSFDLDELRKTIEYYADIVDALTGNTRTNRVARVVPRDL